jgi:hypothetical protein
MWPNSSSRKNLWVADMQKNITKNADTGLGDTILAKSAETLGSINFVEELYAYLDDAPSILAFSATCHAARDLTAPWRLLTAVVRGEEAAARQIITSKPELLIDKSYTADLSGKKITNLTPLKAAICAGDVDMVQMIKEVLQYKLQARITLSFEQELVIQSQLTEVYPKGIDAKEAEQMAIAQEFKTSTLRDIFTAINAESATPALVEFERCTPGQHTGSPLNAALHEFRAQFANTANSEQIFNPFYLLKALEFYDEQFNNFNGDQKEKWRRRELFCTQIIGFTQRYLPACFLQAFAQSLYDLVNNNKKLERNLKFKYGECYMRAIDCDVNNLGYKHVSGIGHVSYLPVAALGGSAEVARCYQKLLRTKSQAWRTYDARDTMAAAPEPTYRLGA